MKALILALCLLVSPASAATHILVKDGDGGLLVDHIARFVDWRNAGDTVRLEGDCFSACTLMLPLIPLDHICATPNASFAFHSASYGLIHSRYAKSATEFLWDMYRTNEKLTRIMAKYGIDKPRYYPDFVYIPAQEIVRPCAVADDKDTGDGNPTTERRS